jgi:titin
VFLALFAAPPSAPLNLSQGETTETSVQLSWKPPSDDGGSDVSAYVVEQRYAKRTSWMKVTTTSDCDVTVSGLNEDNVYVIRVAAKNEVGVGEFAEITVVIPKSRFGKSKLIP